MKLNEVFTPDPNNRPGQAQAKVAGQEWRKGAEGREQIGWEIIIQKGSKYVRLDKIYNTEEDAWKAVDNIWKLPRNQARVVPKYS